MVEIWGRGKETHLLKTNQAEAGSSERWTAASSQPCPEIAFLALWPPRDCQTVHFGLMGRDLFPSIGKTSSSVCRQNHASLRFL